MKLAVRQNMMIGIDSMKEYIIKKLNYEEVREQTVERFDENTGAYTVTFPNSAEYIGELIRCKDCKYNILADRPYFDDAVSIETYQHCYYLAGMTKEMGYCALAERKE